MNNHRFIGNNIFSTYLQRTANIFHLFFLLSSFFFFFSNYFSLLRTDKIHLNPSSILQDKWSIGNECTQCTHTNDGFLSSRNESPSSIEQISEQSHISFESFEWKLDHVLWFGLCVWCQSGCTLCSRLDVVPQQIIKNKFYYWFNLTREKHMFWSIGNNIIHVLFYILFSPFFFRVAVNFVLFAMRTHT